MTRRHWKSVIWVGIDFDPFHLFFPSISFNDKSVLTSDRVEESELKTTNITAFHQTNQINALEPAGVLARNTVVYLKCRKMYDEIDQLESTSMCLYVTYVWVAAVDGAAAAAADLLIAGVSVFFFVFFFLWKSVSFDSSALCGVLERITTMR